MYIDNKKATVSLRVTENQKKALQILAKECDETVTDFILRNLNLEEGNREENKEKVTLKSLDDKLNLILKKRPICPKCGKKLVIVDVPFNENEDLSSIYMCDNNCLWGEVD